jgi:dethiobiotin synthetase
MQGLFLTATDTGAGKTEITAAIARLWRRQGRDFAVCKPVVTGGERTISDTLRLARAAAETDLEAITPFAFAEPAAPPVAARAAGVRLNLGQLDEAVRRRHRPGRALLVEGVGGLLCPLSDVHTVADLALGLDLPLVIVARRSLGTINHTLLTVEVARHRGLRLAGVVISETTPLSGLAEETCPEELRQRLPIPLLGVAPHQAGGYQREIPSISEIDWWSLAQ